MMVNDGLLAFMNNYIFNDGRHPTHTLEASLLQPVAVKAKLAFVYPPCLLLACDSE